METIALIVGPLLAFLAGLKVGMQRRKSRSICTLTLVRKDKLWSPIFSAAMAARIVDRTVTFDLSGDAFTVVYRLGSDGGAVIEGAMAQHALDGVA